MMKTIYVSAKKRYITTDEVLQRIRLINKLDNVDISSCIYNYLGLYNEIMHALDEVKKLNNCSVIFTEKSYTPGIGYTFHKKMVLNILTILRQ